MSQHLTCAQGHNWETDSPWRADPGAVAAACPICGGAGRPAGASDYSTLPLSDNPQGAAAEAAPLGYSTLEPPALPGAPAPSPGSYSTLGPPGPPLAVPEPVTFATLQPPGAPVQPGTPAPPPGRLSTLHPPGAAPPVVAGSFATLKPPAAPNSLRIAWSSGVARDAPERGAAPELSAEPLTGVPLAAAATSGPGELGGKTVSASDLPPIVDRSNYSQFPGTSAIDSAPSAEQKAASSRATPTVPGYEILGILGHGGMGVVYKAVQTRLKRVVALKMILAGAHAAPIQLTRFRAEAEAVARLQHANIVQIHEVGDHEGLPYFSLEYVDGGSLDNKLDGTPLPARAAARLLATLARAMHYAHERGVVHRDLKPANILLEAPEEAHGRGTVSLEPFSSSVRHARPPVPKIADFGLAKQMEGSDAQTQSGAILGTPSYMAPEQARGRSAEVGPLTDVYALGAILYELVTGRVPFRAASAMQTVQQVIAQEPVPPTRLQPGTPRDLETICLKCLEKEPARRYASAAALADDLERYLDNEPILARPAGSWERTVKWVKRRPMQALLCLVIVAALGGALAMWIHFTIEVSAQRDRAEANFQRAMRAVDRMLTEVAQGDQLEHDPQMERKQRALLREALTFYQEFLAEKSADPTVRQKTGLAYKRVGDILRLLKEDLEQARQAYGKAIVLLSELTRDYPAEAEYRHALAESYNWRGELERTAGEHAQAAASFRQARDLQERLVADFADRPAYAKDLARSHYNLAILLWATNRPQEANAAFARAIETLDGLYRRFPAEPAYAHELARCQFNRGPVLRALRKGLQAEAAYREAIALLEDLVAKNPRRREYRRELMLAYTNAGFYYGERPPTPLLAPTAVGLLAEPRGGGPLLAAAALPVCTPTDSLARAAGEMLHRKALAIGQALVADSPDVPDYRSDLATTHINLGQVLAGRDRKAAARAWEEARALLMRLVEERPSVPGYRGDLGMTQGNLGWVLGMERQWEKAAASLNEGIANVRVALKPNPADPNYLSSLRFQYVQLARALLALKRTAEAAQAARALAALSPDRGKDCFDAARLLARCAREAPVGDVWAAEYADDAVKLLQQAHAHGFRQMAGPLRSHADFEVLRRRADFQRLLAALPPDQKVQR